MRWKQLHVKIISGKKKKSKLIIVGERLKEKEIRKLNRAYAEKHKYIIDLKNDILNELKKYILTQ